MKQSKYVVPREVMVNHRHEPLFDFIAKQISSFLEEHPEMTAPKSLDSTNAVATNFFKLGFTFSFTYDSHSVSHGTMLQWDKGWDIPDAIGRDPCRMLQEAIDRRKLHVRVTALTNDSVGTLMAKAYTSSETCSPLIGAIFGTGTNAAYVEDLNRVEKLPQLKAPYQSEESIMVINTEWGAWFDKTPSALPGCVYDDALDRESQAPGEQLYEKRTSGLYLGELARLAISDLMASKQLQMTAGPGSPLLTPYDVDTPFLSMLATRFDDSNDLDLKRLKQEISEALKVENVSNKDAQLLLQLGAAIVKRAAMLAGATIAAIIIHSGRLEAITSKSRQIPAPRCGRWCKWETIRNSLCSFGRSQLVDDAATVDSDSTVKAVADCIEVGIDGSLFEYYPRFEEEIRSALRVVPRIGHEGEARVKIGLAKDGSSLGAALIAQSVL